jgi:hypothetical protein
MSNPITRMRVRNFRSLADVRVDTGPLNVLFGPNGSGKSSFLDTIWFVRDCATRSVELASSVRSHGIGLLFDGAAEGDRISVAVATDAAKYELVFGMSSGRIEPFAGGRLTSTRRSITLIDRAVGSDKASFYHANMQEQLPITLREPENLAWGGIWTSSRPLVKPMTLTDFFTMCISTTHALFGSISSSRRDRKPVMSHG